jgi:hypothetical protein
VPARQVAEDAQDGRERRLADARLRGRRDGRMHVAAALQAGDVRRPELGVSQLGVLLQERERVDAVTVGVGGHVAGGHPYVVRRSRAAKMRPVRMIEALTVILLTS